MIESGSSSGIIDRVKDYVDEGIFDTVNMAYTQGSQNNLIYD